MARTRAFPETYQVGLPQAMRRAGYEEAVIFGSAMMHYSIDKAVDVLGFGAAAVRKIPTDEAFRIDISALKAAVATLPPRTKVVAVVGVAGTTEAGSVDNLEALASIARDCGAHFHVSCEREILMLSNLLCSRLCMLLICRAGTCGSDCQVF